LLEIQKRAAASGASEAVPADGGFLLQPEFSDQIATRVYNQGLLLSRFAYVPVTSASANGIKIAGFDEQSRADGSRWGGVRGYWANEAASVTASRPKYRLLEFALNKLMAVSYATDELLQDAAALGAAMTIAFSGELLWKLEYASLFGSGAGQPLGMLSSGNNALIVVPKDSGQAAATISASNLVTMFAKLHGPSRRNALFLMSESAESQLISAAVAIKNVAGTENVGGIPLYVPATSDDDYPRILGRPAIVVEGMAALGNQGDIALVDPSQYIYSDDGGPDFTSSMHVNFLTDESVFKIRWRVDGKPMWHAPLIPYGGGASLSAYVVLAAR
jgi:HK97 family phage major capsid protein